MRILRALLPGILLLILLSPLLLHAMTSEEEMMQQAAQHFEAGNYYFASTWLERLLREKPATGHRRKALLLLVKSCALTHRDEKAARYRNILLTEYPQEANSLEIELRKIAKARPPAENVLAPTPPSQQPPAAEKSLDSTRPEKGPEVVKPSSGHVEAGQTLTAILPEPATTKQPEPPQPEKNIEPFAKPASDPKEAGQTLTAILPEPAATKQPEPSQPEKGIEPVAKPASDPKEAGQTLTAILPEPAATKQAEPPQPEKNIEPFAKPASDPKEAGQTLTAILPEPAVTKQAEPPQPEKNIEPFAKPASDPKEAGQTLTAILPEPAATKQAEPPQPEKNIEPFAKPASDPKEAGQTLTAILPEPAATKQAEPPQPEKDIALSEHASPVSLPTPGMHEPASVTAAVAPPVEPGQVAPPTTGANGYYFLIAGESLSRKKLDPVVKKLLAARIKPTVAEATRETEVFRLVVACFADRKAAEQKRAQLAHRNTKTFLSMDDDSYCVIAGSLRSEENAEKEYKRLESKGLEGLLIVKTRVPLKIWRVTVGRYADALGAEKSAQALAKRGIVASIGKSSD